MKNTPPTGKHIDHARAFIEELLNSALPGSRLPGMRELMNRSGIGRIRLERILKEFKDRNLIEVRERSGCYLRGNNAAATVAMCHFSHIPVVESETDFIGGITRYLHNAAKTAGLEFQIINAKNLSNNELLELLKSKNIDRLFIFGCHDPELIKVIRQQIPHPVSLLPHYTETIGCELRDSPDMTDMQLKYLFQYKYRRIGYIHNVETDWTRSTVQLKRLMDYYRIMAEHGLKIEPEWVFYCGYNWEHFNQQMYKLMRSARKVEALIVPGSSLKYIYKYCANNGITIGRELAVMGSDDIAPDLQPRATTVTNTPYEIGKQAWQVMLDCCNGIEKHEFTRLQIVTGKTVIRKSE